MDQGSYTYSQLSKKYDNFTAPGFDITVGGTKLEGGKYIIPSLEIELSAEGTSGGCTFQVKGQFDYKNHKWENSLEDIVKPGAKLVVEGGYVERKELFYGYVDDFSFEFDAEGAPCITVNGLDGLGYLMSMREPLYAGKKQAKQIVQSLLGKSVSAGFAKSVKVGSLSGFETPIIKEQLDDWKFLRLMAQRYGATLLAIDGEMIFDTVVTKTSPILTLTLGLSIDRFVKRVSLAHQVGKVEVRGRDINEKPVSGTASDVTVGGSGKSASEYVSGLKDAVLREYNEFVRTQEECEKLAQNRLNGIAMGFISGEGQCVGIPELIPGRYLKIDGANTKANGSYFLTKVCHKFTTETYTTSFEVKGAKL